MAANRDTPAMRQYLSFKERHPDCILFFRMGDFYEMFDEDALTAHKALGITLTQRSEGIPMAGVPYHSVESYLRRMIEQGYRVAVCDQVQDPKEAKGVVERAVTRIITPGTLVDESLLSDDAANNLASVAFLDAGDAPDARLAVAIVELSTGAFTMTSATAREAIDLLAQRNISELLHAETANLETPPRIRRLAEALGCPATARPGWHFRVGEAREALLEVFGVRSLEGFGLSDEDAAIPAAGAIVRYLHETQAMDLGDAATSEGFSSGTRAAMMLRKRTLAHLRPPRRENPGAHLLIDAASLRALEVERTLRASAGRAAQDGDHSLLGVFSASRGAGCRTPMGKRLLRDWLCRPLRERTAIEARQACVGALVSDERAAEALDAALRCVQDVARISARVALGRATPRDLVALGRSLGAIDGLADAIDRTDAFRDRRAVLLDLRDRLAPIASDITERCEEAPPAHLREGGLFRTGFDPELDEARALQQESGRWLADYQQRLIAEHDLPSLKVGYNKVFGYYIELPAAQARRAPDIFTRKQTLKNAERYITPELKTFEDKVLTAGERAVRREQELFNQLCERIAASLDAATRFADTVAELDVLACFAVRAALRGWTRPTITEEPILDITDGRHPVLESILDDAFVPNDLRLGLADADAEPPANEGHPPYAPGAPLALITGPNMAGKSTFIRQVALITLLAHTGSFVPAMRARIGLTDRIFTRIGADDALHAGQSTFMVEMVETANILHNATDHSLVILDEIGRGTSTLDGLSLAWAIAERLAGAEPAAPTPRTLFATHYHELTDLADRLPERVRNLHVSVREWGEEIVFLHRILPGRTNRSYGIHVARLAGLPRATIARASDLLDSLTVSHEHVGERAEPAPDGTPASRAFAPARQSAQLALFTEFLSHPAVERLRELKIESMTPLEAFDALRALQSSARDGAPRLPDA